MPAAAAAARTELYFELCAPPSKRRTDDRMCAWAMLNATSMIKVVVVEGKEESAHAFDVAKDPGEEFDMGSTRRGIAAIAAARNRRREIVA